MRARDLVVTSFAAGAACMYFLDPNRGRRRRHLTKDKLGRWSRDSKEFAKGGWIDLRQRARGVGAETKSRLWSRGVPDEVLVERVRSVLGHHTSHSRGIEVSVDSGNVLLTGPVLAEEADRLAAAASRVPGVRQVHNELELHEHAEGVPALQGGGANPSRTKQWSPASRLVSVMSGGAAIGFATLRRSPWSPLVALCGAAAVLRGALNQPLRRVGGWEDDEPVFEIQKSVWIDAPPENVYRIWSRPEHFPMFMEHVSAVEHLEEDRYRWSARGPAGFEVSWISEVTEREPDKLIRWESVDGSQMVMWGQASFVAEGAGTRVHLWLAYTPPTGGAGHVLAWVLGDDPKTALDEDLLRLKSLIEDGKASVRGEEVRFGELGAG